MDDVPEGYPPENGHAPGPLTTSPRRGVRRGCPHPECDCDGGSDEGDDDRRDFVGRHIFSIREVAGFISLLFAGAIGIGTSYLVLTTRLTTLELRQQLEQADSVKRIEALEAGRTHNLEMITNLDQRLTLLEYAEGRDHPPRPKSR